jgi:Fe-S oxidoreductase
MLAILVGALSMFGWAASRRWLLFQVGRGKPSLTDIGQRLAGTWRFAFRQEKMDYYLPAGIAHKLIFTGFLVLSLRTLILWGRAFSPSFNLFILGPESGLGMVYEFAKDTVAVMVLCGVLVFAYYRVINKQKRMTLSAEGLLILGIIGTMMIADMAYDGAGLVLKAQNQYNCGVVATQAQCMSIATIIAPLGHAHEGYSFWPSPAGSLFSTFFWTLSPGALIVVAHAGYWIHSTLVLVFLNLLPHSKHFHVITAIPNVFLRDLSPAGRLKPMADSAEKLMEALGAAGELSDPQGALIGASRMEHFSWKAILDFYTCTECGRCTDNCPANTTGKVLSPKHLTLALRDNLYHREEEFIKNPPHKANGAPKAEETPKAEEAAPEGEKANGTKPVNLVPDVVHPDVIWGCTTCRACEEQCPVLISYVDKIVDMRRNLVMVANEFPHPLQKPFQAMEVNGNPWNFSPMDRAAWADGLDIPTMAEKPTAEVLFWVGCSPSFDDRAKKIARATAKLLKLAKVDFAILGQEEKCTGDAARRAGNEVLFAMLAEENAATLNGYKDQGGIKTIVTTCPHCFNTLKNEYPDFGAKFDVVHHSDFLLGLLVERRLVPKNAVQGRVVYHDSCYLGRYNGVYDAPREVLRRIPGVELVEPEYWTKQRGLCCGAGGAQMFMEEQNTDRINVKRTLQLIDTQAKTIASACPFCMTMLTDGLKSKSLEDSIKQLDIAEMLERSCATESSEVTSAVLAEVSAE